MSSCHILRFSSGCCLFSFKNWFLPFPIFKIFRFAYHIYAAMLPLLTSLCLIRYTCRSFQGFFGSHKFGDSFFNTFLVFWGLKVCIWAQWMSNGDWHWNHHNAPVRMYRKYEQMSIMPRCSMIMAIPVHFSPSTKTISGFRTRFSSSK